MSYTDLVILRPCGTTVSPVLERTAFESFKPMRLSETFQYSRFSLIEISLTFGCAKNCLSGVRYVSSAVWAIGVIRGMRR